MKILHLLQSKRFSGAENVVCQIIGMMKDQPDVEMVYCSADGQIRQALQERGIPFVPMKKLCFREVCRVLKQEKPDVIHAHDMGASFFAALACGKTKLISHIHNNAFDSRGVSLKSIAFFLAARKAKHIFWVSQSAYDGYVFHKTFQRKSSVLYNIIDVDDLYRKMELDTNTYTYDVTYVGRLTYPKNPQRLMKIFKMLKEQKPDMKAAVIGTGDLEQEVRSLAESYDLLDNVDFLGFQANPLKILHDSKVMVMTSRFEGTPMVALEAMALGVPIVSTPVDGLKDLVFNGENGYLSDDDDELVRQILQIITDPQLHAQYSAYMKQQALRINALEPYRDILVTAYED